MATKYQIESLCTRIVQHVQADWPTTLQEWDRFEAETNLILKEHQDKDDRLINGLHFHERIPEPCSAIRLAREFNIPQILPAAFYTLAQIEPSEDMDDPAVMSSFITFRGVSRLARWSQLSAKDYRSLLRGLYDLRLEMSLLQRLQLHKSGCESKEDCEVLWNTNMNNVTYAARNMSVDVLQAWKIACHESDGDFCAPCLAACRRYVREKRESWWASLPDYFCLEP